MGAQDSHSTEQVWQAAMPQLGALLAEAALRAVDTGELALVSEDHRRTIVSLDEANDRRTHGADHCVLGCGLDSGSVSATGGQ